MSTSFTMESIATEIERGCRLLDEAKKILTLCDLQLKTLRKLALEALDADEKPHPE